MCECVPPPPTFPHPQPSPLLQPPNGMLRVQMHRQDAQDLMMDMYKSSADSRRPRPVKLPYATADGEVTLDLVEKNVFCGASTVIMCDGMDDTRVVGYAGGDIAVSGSADKLLRFYDINSGFVVGKASGHAGSIRSVAVSPRHNIVLSGSYDSSARVWDLTTHKCLGILRGHKSTVTAVHIDDDTGVAATGSKDRRFIVWHAPTRKMLKSVSTHAPVTCVFSGSGVACCGSKDGDVLVLDVATGNRVKAIAAAHQGETLAVAADNHFVVSGGEDRMAQLWSLQACSPGPLLSFRHVGAVTSVHLLFCRTVTASDDGKIRIWNNVDGTCVKIFRGNSASRPIRQLCPFGDQVLVVNTTTTMHFQLFTEGGRASGDRGSKKAAKRHGQAGSEDSDTRTRRSKSSNRSRATDSEKNNRQRDKRAGVSSGSAPQTAPQPPAPPASTPAAPTSPAGGVTIRVTNASSSSLSPLLRRRRTSTPTSPISSSSPSQPGSRPGTRGAGRTDRRRVDGGGSATAPHDKDDVDGDADSRDSSRSSSVDALDGMEEPVENGGIPRGGRQQQRTIRDSAGTGRSSMPHSKSTSTLKGSVSTSPHSNRHHSARRRASMSVSPVPSTSSSSPSSPSSLRRRPQTSNSVQRGSSPNAWLERRQRPSQADIPLPTILQETVLASTAASSAVTTAAAAAAAAATTAPDASRMLSGTANHRASRAAYNPAAWVLKAARPKPARAGSSHSAVAGGTADHSSSGKAASAKQQRAASGGDGNSGPGVHVRPSASVGALRGSGDDGDDGGIGGAERERALRSLRFGRQFSGQWRTLMKMPQLANDSLKASSSLHPS